MRTALCCLAALMTAALLGCSEAETPNAGFDAGPINNPGPDAGGQTGARDEPCNADNTCDNPNTLRCVNDVDGVAKCRLVCDPDVANACGGGQVCTGLIDAGESVCAPD